MPLTLSDQMGAKISASWILSCQKLSRRCSRTARKSVWAGQFLFITSVGKIPGMLGDTYFC